MLLIILNALFKFQLNYVHSSSKLRGGRCARNRPVTVTLTALETRLGRGGATLRSSITADSILLGHGRA